MLTDEELIGQIRRRLHEELDEMYPADRVIHVWEEIDHPTVSPVTSASPGHRQRPSFRTAMGVVGAVVAGAIVVVAALALLGRPERSSLRAGGSPEQPLLRVLGVLRRPQTKADLPLGLRESLMKEARGTLARAHGVPVLAGVRLATVTPSGLEVFLVPVRPPTKAAISAFASKLPPKVGARVRANLEREARAHGGQDQLKIAEMYRPGARPGPGALGGSQCCITAQDIERGPVGFHSGSAESSNGTGSSQATLVVPDGVAKVTFLVPVTAQNSPTTVVTVTAQVHNNVVVAQLPEAPDEQREATIFYGPSGNVLRRFGRIPKPTTSTTCRPGRRFLCGQPPASITSVLGSLGRRPSPGERLSQDFLRSLGWGGSGIYVRYARRGQINGVPYYLIPMSDVGGRCCAGQPGVQLIVNYGGDQVADRISLSELRAHLEPKSFPAGDTITPLVVPDEVATVTAHYAPVGYIPHQVVTQRAKDNILIFRSRVMGRSNPPSLTYRSATGAILWSSRPR